MKKRKWVLPVCIIGGVLLLCLAGVGAFLIRYCSGIYVRTSGGRHMVVFDDSGPVILSTKDKPDRFDGIETGDRIIAVCGFVHETYPAQSEAKLVLRLGKGDLEDIPQEDRDALWELGRLFENTETITEGDADSNRKCCLEYDCIWICGRRGCGSDRFLGVVVREAFDRYLPVRKGVYGLP